MKICMIKNTLVNIYRKSFIIILIIVLNSCHKPQSPEFISVDNIEVSAMASSRIKLAAEANFHNPNKYDIILKKADIDVFFNDNFITNYSKEYNLKIEKNSDFTVPVEVELSLKDLDLNMISSAVNAFLGKKPEIEYDGSIKVKAYGFGIQVPVKGKSKLDIKF